MRKTYPLSIEGKHPDRVLDAVRHDIRQYMKRERRKPLPPETQFWDFDCRFGADEASAAPLHPAELLAAIDRLAQAGEPQVYVELRAKPAVRQWRPRPEGGSAESVEPANGDAAGGDGGGGD